MLDLTNAPESFLDPVARVVQAALALGHSFATAATRDLDLALALTSWDAYRTLAAAFPRIGDSGIRFRIADVNVDLLTFGEIEDPQGVVEPPSRRETLTAWAFEEIFAASLPLVLSPILTVRIPTVAGYAAAKWAPGSTAQRGSKPRTQPTLH